MPDQRWSQRWQCVGKRQYKSVRFLLLLISLTFTLSCGAHHLDAPQATFDGAKSEFLHGRLELAEQNAARGVKQFGGRDPEWTWRFRILEADILVRRGFSEKALLLLNSAVPPNLNPDIIIQKQVLQAVALTRLGRLAEANQNLLEAERLCGTSCGVEFEIITARGVLALGSGMPDSAERFFRRSLQAARQKQDISHEAEALLNLGVAVVRQERYDESIDWWNSALLLSQKMNYSLNEEKALGNLGWAYYRIGDFDKSRIVYDDAAKRAHDLGIEIDEARWSYNLGSIYYDTDQLSTAEGYLRTSLDLTSKIGNIEQKKDTLSTLAFVSAKLGNLDAAEQYSQQALELARHSNDRGMELYSLLSQGQIRSRRDTKLAEPIFIEIAHDKNSDSSLRWQAQSELAQLYEQMNRTEAAAAQYNAALNTLECARNSLHHEEFRLPFLANAARVYDDYIHFLVAHGKTAKALQAADYSRAQTLNEGLGFLKTKQNCSSISGNVPLGEAVRKAGGIILFYWLGQRQSYLWVVGNRVTLFKLPPAKEIEALVQDYRKALLDPPDVLQNRNPDGIKLYETLVAPARKLIPANSHVTVIADGSLNNLNFETLLVAEPQPHYWIEDVSLTNANSLRMLASSKTVRSQRNGNLLLIGDPVVPDPKFPALPSAKIEMQNIEKHFPAESREVFSGSAANPLAFFNSKPESFSYLHFVAHGTASQISPLDSAVILSKGTSEEDSYKLHARDIVSHPLRADLAVISTCYGSGTTLYNGEGLVGLSWAFLRAGSHNVIGALWAVSDASTPQLMDQLYTELRKGRNPQDALRTAKLSLLHSGGTFRKPIYWAPFQLYSGS